MVMGQEKVIFATFAAVTSGDTFPTGLTNVDHVVITSTTAQTVGATVAGGIITLLTGGVIAMSVMVYGTP
jgi:hypothetical protein